MQSSIQSFSCHWQKQYAKGCIGCSACCLHLRIEMYPSIYSTQMCNGICNAKSNETCLKQFVPNIELYTWVHFDFFPWYRRCFWWGCYEGFGKGSRWGFPGISSGCDSHVRVGVHKLRCVLLRRKINAHLAGNQSASPSPCGQSARLNSLTWRHFTALRLVFRVENRSSVSWGGMQLI